MPSVFVSCGFMTEREVVELTPAIEELGFDGITLPDHVFAPETEGPYPYSADGKPPFALDTPWPDPFVLIGALGVLTTRLRFMTSVYILPLRHPVIVAKAAASASRLCDGRLILGVGVGWRREEFDVLGIPFEGRGARTNEAIGMLRTLWSDQPVEHEGDVFSFPRAYVEPVPPPIPIVVGGKSDAALRRVATLADGYILPGQPLAGMPAELDRVRAALDAVGRDLSDLDIYVPCLGAPAEEILAILEPAIGNVVVIPWPHPGKVETSMAEKLQHLERYASDALVQLREGVTR
jgi:probable F420-dependent oxidoreductase